MTPAQVWENDFAVWTRPAVTAALFTGVLARSECRFSLSRLGGIPE